MKRPSPAKAALVGSALVSAIAAKQAVALTNSIPKGTIAIKLTSLSTVNTASDGTPQDIATEPGDGTGRIFVATRNGDIRILSGTTLSSTPFLDESTAGISIYTGGEGGLLGLAFSPNFQTDHKFYTYQTEPFSTSGPAADYASPEQFPTTSINPNNQIVLREWTTPSATSNTANTTSRVLLRINHPESNHQGGSLRFGADGNLYLGLGDGGGANDFNGSATSTTDGHNNAIGNAQDTTMPLGKILRINPNPAAGAGFTVSTNGQYSIPNTNPFISGANGNLKEIYAYGLRNPFRSSFDPTAGTFYVADVGQGQREEIDTITNGGNYGWVFREGTRDNSGANGSGRTTPAGFTSIAPISEYTHGDGIAIIGGELYRGSAVPAAAGKYIFGDLGSSIGRMFYTDPANGNIFELKYDASGATPPSSLYGVTRGPNNELYATFSNGAIMRIDAGVFSSRWNLSTGSSWNTAGNWTLGVPNGPADRANLLASPGLTSAATITLDGSRTVGQLTFNNSNGYTIATGTGGTLTFDDTFDTGGVDPLITVTAGSHTIAAPITLANGLAMSAAAGTALSITGNISGTGALKTNAGSGVVTINGKLSITGNLTANGPLDFGGNSGAVPLTHTFAALSIGSGVTLTANTSTNAFVPVVLHGTTLSFADSTSKLDLKNNELQSTMTLAQIMNFLFEATPRIVTSAGGPGVLGYADIGGGVTEVRYTLNGDTNLDGTVGVGDLGALATHYGSSSGVNWQQGDFDHSGVVNVGDLGALATNYGNSIGTGPASASAAAATSVEAAAVPEPASVACVLVPALALRRRRRK
jgi:glucose/arabinose dehydrogenase